MYRAPKRLLPNLPNGSFALMIWDGSLGSPNPALFSALTLNWYWVFSMRSPTVKFSSFSGALVTFIHLSLTVSRFSMTYPVIGEPPSCLGGVHSRWIELVSMFATSGLPGASGTSEMGQGVIICWDNVIFRKQWLIKTWVLYFKNHSYFRHKFEFVN